MPAREQGSAVLARRRLFVPNLAGHGRRDMVKSEVQSGTPWGDTSDPCSKRYMALGLARRKPMLLLRLVGLLLLRFAARAFCALLFHVPPRRTRFEPVCLVACSASCEPSYPGSSERAGVSVHGPANLTSRAALDVVIR